jgi:excisionase family DNA binding protein
VCVAGSLRCMAADEQELLSPQQVADRLGFSREHVVTLLNAGELAARKPLGSSDWRIPLATVLAFEERSRRAGEMADEFSRSLDALGAPLE